MGDIDFSKCHEFQKLFKQESDRACVILSAAAIDECMRSLIFMKLVGNPSSTDPLFDGPTAPLSSFSSKIDMAFRIGLISSSLCRDLHILRKIRNDFAHNLSGCHFTDQAVRDRIALLKHSFKVTKENGPRADYGPIDDVRSDFEYICSMVLVGLGSKITETVQIENRADEFIYRPPTISEWKKIGEKNEP